MFRESSAQELSVFPEIALIAESNLNTLNCDLPPAARNLELLSPGVLRNSWFSVLLIVRHNAGEPYTLDAGQYPARAFDLHLRRIVPGAPNLVLEAVDLPFRGRIPEGQGCALFILDAFVKAQTNPDRVKLEPALWSPTMGQEKSWIRYPMEVRVLYPTLSPPALPGACGEDLLQATAAAAAQACIPHKPACSVGPSLESLLLRNLHQDISARPGAKPCGDVALAPATPAGLLNVRARIASGK